MTIVADMLQGYLTPILVAILWLHMPFIKPGNVSGVEHFSSSLVEASARTSLHRKWSTMKMKN